MCLVALGSYGRRELCPHSDIDLLLLHDGQDGVGDAAERLWYPIWATSRRLDHSVRTVPETLAVAAGDLKVALGLLDARWVAGDRELYRRLADRSRRLWEDRASALLPELHRSITDRHARHGEVAFLLEPQLKEGRGGLRDVTAMAAAITARPGLGLLPPEVNDSRDALLAIRAALHLRTGRMRRRRCVDGGRGDRRAHHFASRRRAVAPSNGPAHRPQPQTPAASPGPGAGGCAV